MGPVRNDRAFFMPFYVYILQSESSDRYYIGHTADLSRRLSQHYDPDYKGSKTTKRFQGPWKLVWQREFASRSEAMYEERKIKGRGAKRYLDAQLVESRQRRD